MVVKKKTALKEIASDHVVIGSRRSKLSLGEHAAVRVKGAMSR